MAARARAGSGNPGLPEVGHHPARSGPVSRSACPLGAELPGPQWSCPAGARARCNACRADDGLEGVGWIGERVRAASSPCQAPQPFHPGYRGRGQRPARRWGPGTRGRRRHRVPLSRRAQEVLAEARALAPRSQLVFPGRSGRRLCSRTLSVLARPLGCVPHGFRTSFRNWCGETGVPREVAERCLAHLVRNQVERAYSRTDLLERRRKVMEGWARYIAR